MTTQSRPFFSKKPHDEGMVPPTDLHSAITYSNLNAVKELIAKKADVQQCIDGEPLLNLAARNWRPNAIPIVLELLKARASVNGDGSATSPLRTAALWGRKEIIEVLLANGANIEQGYYETALDAAIQKGEEASVHTLLQARARISHQNLEIASALGQTVIVKALLDAKATMLESDALGCATKNGHTGVIKTLIAAKAEVDSPGSEGLPLLTAFKNEQYEAAKVLIEAKASLEITDNQGHTVLDLVIQKNIKQLPIFLPMFPFRLRPSPDQWYEWFVELINPMLADAYESSTTSELMTLLEAKMPVDYIPPGRKSVLQLARDCHQSVIDAIEETLRKKRAIALFAGLYRPEGRKTEQVVAPKPLSRQQLKDKSSLLDAIVDLDLLAVKKLLEEKADPNLTNRRIVTTHGMGPPLHIAVGLHDRQVLPIISALLEAKAICDEECVTQATERGRLSVLDVLFKANPPHVSHIVSGSILDKACRRGDGPLVKKLLGYGAHVDMDLQTMKNIIYGGNPDILKIILQKYPHVKDLYIRSLLPYAVSIKAKTEIIQELIKAKADVEITDSDRRPLLVIAAEGPYKDQAAATMKLLLDAKASVNAWNLRGETALHRAVLCCPLFISQLLAAKADVHASDNSGYTPLHRAVLDCPHDRPPIISALIEAKAAADYVPLGSRSVHEMIKNNSEVPQKVIEALWPGLRSDPWLSRTEITPSAGFAIPAEQTHPARDKKSGPGPGTVTPVPITAGTPLNFFAEVQRKNPLFEPQILRLVCNAAGLSKPKPPEDTDPESGPM